MDRLLGERRIAVVYDNDFAPLAFEEEPEEWLLSRIWRVLRSVVVGSAAYRHAEKGLWFLRGEGELTLPDSWAEARSRMTEALDPRKHWMEQYLYQLQLGLERELLRAPVPSEVPESDLLISKAAFDQMFQTARIRREITETLLGDPRTLLARGETGSAQPFEVTTLTQDIAVAMVRIGSVRESPQARLLVGPAASKAVRLEKWMTSHDQTESRLTKVVDFTRLLKEWESAAEPSARQLDEVGRILEERGEVLERMGHMAGVGTSEW